MTEIMNGGIRANLLKIAQESGAKLTQDDKKFMDKMLSLPKNVWINLDDKGNVISKEQANDQLKKELTRYTPNN